MKNVFAILLGAAVLSAGSVAWAALPADAPSKQNTEFEAQGNLGVLGDLVRNVLDAGILGDGVLELGYDVIATDQSAIHGATLKVESRIWGTSDHFWGAQVLPFEFKVRLPVAERGNSFHVQEVKVALFRMLLNQVGLTFNFLEYTHERHEGRGVVFNQGGISAVLNEVLSIDRAGDFQIVIKGRAGFGAGGVHSTVPTGWRGSPGFILGAGSVSAGLNLYERVLTEGFASGMLASENSIQNYALGGAVRVRIVDSLYLKARVQHERERYRSDFVPNLQDSPGEEASGWNTTRPTTSGFAVLEFRW